jgi:hypothetical protein
MQFDQLLEDLNSRQHPSLQELELRGEQQCEI